jgi:sortase A
MFHSLKKNWIILVGLLMAFYGTAGTTTIVLEREGLKASSPAHQPGAGVQFQVLNPPAKALSEPATLSLPGFGTNNLHRLPEPILSGDDEGKPLAWLPAREPGEEIQRTPVEKAPPEVPIRLVIPTIDLDAPVSPAETKILKVGGVEYQQWLAPDQFAIGWHTGSARLGEAGNTVFNGHHNVYGEVFRHLVDVEVGDPILVYSWEHLFTYQITNMMILPEKYQGLDVRMENAHWILPSQDERLTLITCWPYESNTHRLIIVARPVSREKLARILQ